MRNKKISINKNLVAFLILGMVLISCSNKNKTTDNISNSQVVFSKANTIADKNTDIMFLSTIYFDFNSHIITIESKQNLNLLTKYLKDENNTGKTVILSGYCDELGSDKYNYELGLKRVEETKNYLVSLGISESRISVASFGKSMQSKQSAQSMRANAEESEEIRRFNRKVVITLE
jgi:peptidoglycan-associated lipoprotein